MPKQGCQAAVTSTWPTFSTAQNTTTCPTGQVRLGGFAKNFDADGWPGFLALGYSSPLCIPTPGGQGLRVQASVHDDEPVGEGTSNVATQYGGALCASIGTLAAAKRSCAVGIAFADPNNARDGATLTTRGATTTRAQTPAPISWDWSGRAIPDLGTATDSQTVPSTETGTSGTITINLDVTHTSTGDLYITLAHGGVTAVLWDHAGAGTDNIEQSFSTAAFAATSRSGTWSLTIQDTVGGDTGKLNNWAITFPASGPAQVSYNTPFGRPDGNGIYGSLANDMESYANHLMQEHATLAVPTSATGIDSWNGANFGATLSLKGSDFTPRTPSASPNASKLQADINRMVIPPSPRARRRTTPRSSTAQSRRTARTSSPRGRARCTRPCSSRVFASSTRIRAPS